MTAGMPARGTSDRSGQTRGADRPGDRDQQQAADNALADRIADVLFREKPDDYMDAAPLLVPLVREVESAARAGEAARREKLVTELRALAASLMKNADDCTVGERRRIYRYAAKRLRAVLDGDR